MSLPCFNADPSPPSSYEYSRNSVAFNDHWLNGWPVRLVIIPFPLVALRRSHGPQIRSVDERLRDVACLISGDGFFVVGPLGVTTHRRHVGEFVIGLVSCPQATRSIENLAGLRLPLLLRWVHKDSKELQYSSMGYCCLCCNMHYASRASGWESLTVNDTRSYKLQLSHDNDLNNI